MLKLKNGAMLIVAALCGYLALMTPDWKGQIIAATSQAYVSDFNADGTDDFLLNNTKTGDNKVWLLTNHLVTATNVLQRMYRQSFVGLIDADGDADEDVLWYDPLTTGVTIWNMQAGNILTSNFVANTSGSVLEGLGDFDGDGDWDILLRNPATKAVRVWRLQNMVRVGGRVVGTLPGTYMIRDVGDFNGDGIDDVLLQDAAGHLRVWHLNALGGLASNVYTGAAGTAMRFKKAGDTDNDGDDDLVFRNDATGQTVVWSIDNGVRQTAYTYAGNNPSFQLALVADFDQDGDVDLLFRDVTAGNATDGQTTLWTIDNNLKTGTANLGRNSIAYRLRAIADTDGDGDRDLVFQRPDTGAVEIANMNGAAVLGRVVPTTSYSESWKLMF